MKNIFAIDCGGTNLRVALLDNDLNIIDVKKIPTVLNDAEKLKDTIISLIEEICYEKKVKSVDSIGMSYCGIVENDMLGSAKNLGIESYDLKSRLQEKFKKAKIKIANDANCAALAESLYGLGKGKETTVFVTISTGIGMGVSYQGKMIDLPFETGRNIIEYKGKLYESENLLSGKGILQLCVLNNLNVKSAEQFFIQVKEKDTQTLLVYDEWLKLMAMWFANVQLAFNSDIFSLSGGVMQSSDVFLEDLQQVANAYIAMWHFKPIVLKYAKFGQDVGIIGAGALAQIALKGNK